MTQQLIVPARFRGPAVSGNGGWTSGALASMVPVEPAPGSAAGDRPPAVEVTLRRPPPLDTPLPVVTTPTSARCEVAEAVIVDRDLWLVEPVSAEAAAEAEAAYPGLRRHPFPTCFACGPGREPGDGLRIFPGRVADSTRGGRRAAATWTPHASVATAAGDQEVSPPVTWAALDCIGGWAEDLENRPMVLGRMTTRVVARPTVGEQHVVVGERLDRQGRKTFTAATLYTADGRVLAQSEHVWIAVDPTTFN